MKLLNSRWKYLLLIPIIFLVANAVYFKNAITEIENALLMEKYNETVNTVNMLAATVEENSGLEQIEKERIIHDMIEFTDKLYQIYAGAYKLIEGEYILMTERFYETSPFEPFDFAEFAETVPTQGSGDIVIGYAPENQEYRELHLYFRHMPANSPTGEHYLVVAGVSKYSVTSSIPAWVSSGLWVNMGITFAINTCLILLLVRLGYIYEQRTGEKWRDRRNCNV